jgi:threonine/homoserine/homoserine lactone efflux protein
VLGALVAFTLAGALIVLLPGPDTMMFLRSLVRGGRRQATLTAAGALTGLAVWVCAAALGLSALLRASHDGYLALRLAGAAYLIWIGVQSLRSRGVAPRPDGKPSRAGVLGTGYLAGLTTDLLNPKVGVFFVTFLPSFVPHGAPVGPTCLLFGAIFISEGAAFYAALLTASRGVTRWMTDTKVRRRLDRTTGVVLVALGARLATEG